MAMRFIPTDPETGDGYNIDDDTGTVYDTSGNTLDPTTAEPNDPSNYSNEGRNHPADPNDPSNYSNEGRNHPANPSLANVAVGDPSTHPGPLSAIAKALGLKDANDNYDWGKLLALAGLGVSGINSIVHPPKPIQSIAELQAGMPAMNTPANWTPEEMSFGTRPLQTGTNLQHVFASDMPSPITPGAAPTTAKRFADGGGVDGQPMGALSQAFAGAVQGSDGGQSDLIDAKLSPGEYVLDAETVSALGDGNTAAGIAKLDQLRQQLREQKRGAPANDIPPQAQGPLSYMQGGQ